MHKMLKTAVMITDNARSRNQKNDFIFISELLQHNFPFLYKI